MRQFRCQCGQAVFFESNTCVACGAVLGFEIGAVDMLSLRVGSDGLLLDPNGRAYRQCANGVDHGVCNWLMAPDDDNHLCVACRFNRTIPNLSSAQNLRRWSRFEIAKKRLLFTLHRLELPLVNGFEDPANGLLFDFIEDHRSNPERYPESFVQTGFHGGIVTINAMEADDAVRESIRVEMQEPYRTLLGHLRHESGHYYWSLLNPDGELRERFRHLFGHDETGYAEALAAYYAEGPPADWPERFISAYASAHPLEDWAETWGHYLLIYDALETAACFGLIAESPEQIDIGSRIAIWADVSVTLNELNRSSGHADAYPFVLNAEVARKLALVDEVIRRFRSRRSASGLEER